MNKFIEIKRSTFPRLLFFVFLCILSYAAYTLGYLPFMVYGLFSVIVGGYGDMILNDFYLSMLNLFIPLIIVLAPFIILNKIRSKKYFIIITFLTILLSYSLGYSYLYSNLNNDTLFVGTFLLYILLITFVIYRTWLEILINKRVSITMLLVIPLFDLIIVLFESNAGLSSDKISLFNLYITVGEFLNHFYKFNFFWLDYSGFAILFVNLLNCILTLLLLYIPRLMKR